MGAKDKAHSLNRRTFMTAALATSGATVASSVTAQQSAAVRGNGPLPPPSAAAVAKESAPIQQRDDEFFVRRAGSDFMVDVIKSTNVDYVATTAGSSFRGLHESIINYGHNIKPEMLTVLHEEIALGMGQGYAKVTGKPLLACIHGTVGLQHGSMAIYNAWCDRVPLICIAGNTMDAAMRRTGVEWTHSVQDCATTVRDFTKWDDQPVSLQHFAESFLRAHKIAMTPPMGPVVLVVDSELQEREVEGAPFVPKLVRSSAPQGDAGSVIEAARLLVGATTPVILVDRLARTPAGVDLLVEFAEALGAPVVDKFGRMNMPNRHYLNHSERGRELIQEADVIIGIELTDFWGTVNQFRDRVHRDVIPAAKETAKLISVTSQDLFLKANYQDFQRFTSVDVAVSGDGEATLPSLIEAVRREMNAGKADLADARRQKLKAAFVELRHRAKVAATYAWDASPVSTARLHAELWELLRHENWSLVSDAFYTNFWPQRLWDIKNHHHYLGNSGGYGIGGNLSAAVGAALANRDQGRISINIQGDGDLMAVPASLWTLARHKVPLLTIVHNNGGYHQEIMHVQRIADRRQRGVDRCSIGTKFDDPSISYVQLAKSMGVKAEGPVDDPKDLGAVLKRALDVVKAGEPALVDVVSQPR
ncbi:thiamine pyrophosphate-binding protein [Bradyrhizobium sp. 14AA]